MSTEEQDRASGSVPNAFGNALAWKWSRDMPTPLRRGFLTLLYALRAIANANGELRFSGDRKPIRIQDIAKASCVREKDARRYLEAAIRAGVVTIRGERKRGVATLYVLLPSPFPNWKAAEDYLTSTARRPGKEPAPWSEPDESSGHRGPNQIGPPRPELTDGTDQEVRATAAPWSSGHRGPKGSGHRGPNNPGVTHVSSHDGAEFGSQPHLVGAREEHAQHADAQEPNPDDHATWRLCPGCDRRIMPDPQRPDRTWHARCEDATTRPERHSA